MTSSVRMKGLKSFLVKNLPPKTLHRLVTIKRAVMGQQPVPGAYPLRVPKNLDNASLYNNRIRSEPPNDNYTIQDYALAALKDNKIHADWVYHGYNEVLTLAGQEIAKALTLGVDYIKGSFVLGDIAEFGTMSGSTARTLAMAMVFDPLHQPLPKNASGENPFRVLHLFDSFEGLPEITDPADINSPHVVSGAWSKGGCKVLAASELAPSIAKIIPPHRFKIYEGWFSDTVKKLPPETRFALIHFDGDLYSSTMDALVPLFERGMISTGAMLFFADWNANRAIPETGERKAWKDLVERFDIKSSHCGDYGSISTRFIIHSYRGIPVDPV